jgi:hypothetical protein
VTFHKSLKKTQILQQTHKKNQNQIENGTTQKEEEEVDILDEISCARSPRRSF